MASKQAQEISAPNILFPDDTFADDVSLFDAIHAQLHSPSDYLRPPSLERERISPLLPSPPPRILPPRKDLASSLTRPKTPVTPPALVNSALVAWVNSPDLSDSERSMRECISWQMSEVSFGEEIYLSIASLTPAALSVLTTLPENLVVGEGFCIDESSPLQCLPDFLRVLGTLEIKHTGCLGRPPYALFVEGDLIIGGDPQMPPPSSHEFLPGHSAASSFYLPSRRTSGGAQTTSCEIGFALGPHLTVFQDLTIKANVAPIALPASLAVGGSLCIQNASLLRCRGLPPSVGQDVTLLGLAQSEFLFESWPVAGALKITGAGSLKELSAELSVGGRCEISGAWSLEYISPDAEFFGDLCLSELFVLEGLPTELTVGRDLHLVCASALAALPDRLTVGRNLRVTEASSLRRFGRSIRIGRDFILCRAPLLVTLPNFLVGGKVVLLKCAALERLGPTQTFPRGLHIIGALRLESFPDTLKVRDELVIDASPALERLGGDLRLGTLRISDAPRIVALPAGTEVTANLTLRSLASLKELHIPSHLSGSLTLVDLPVLTDFDVKRVTVAGRIFILQCPQLDYPDAGTETLLEKREDRASDARDYQFLVAESTSPKTDE